MVYKKILAHCVKKWHQPHKAACAYGVLHDLHADLILEVRCPGQKFRLQLLKRPFIFDSNIFLIY